MATTPNIGLEILIEGQANKEASITEAHQQLDALVQGGVKDRDLATPPGSPSEGDLYLVAASATGAWTGQDGKIAHYRNSAWTFITPQEGWRFYVADEDKFIIYDGSSWATVGGALDVQEGGTSVLAEASALNFTGTGVSVTDGGGGRADISISGGGGLLGHQGLWEQIDRQEFSAVSSVIIGGGQTPGNYDAYLLLLLDVVPGTDGETVSVLVSTDGGSTFINDYVRLGRFWRTNATNDDFSSPTAISIPTSGFDSAASNKALFGRLEVLAPASSNHKLASWNAAWPDDGSNSIMRMHIENYWIEDTGELNSFMIQASNGTISGSAVLIGLKKSETAGRLVEETGTGRTLSGDDNNRIVDFTNAGTGVTVTVPDSLPQGLICRIVNQSGGLMTVSAGGSLTIIGDTSIAQNQGAEIWVVTATTALVSAF